MALTTLPVVSAPTDRDLLAFFGWQKDAACREHPDLSWFPEVGQTSRRQYAICAKCLVQTECREAGMATEDHGIWGATSGRDRMRLRRMNRLTEAA